MGGGASVHKRQDNNSDSSTASSRNREGSSSQKQSKSGFRIRNKRKQKGSTPTGSTPLSRANQGSMGKLERGKLIPFITNTWSTFISHSHLISHINEYTAHFLSSDKAKVLEKLQTI